MQIVIPTSSSPTHLQLSLFILKLEREVRGNESVCNGRRGFEKNKKVMLNKTSLQSENPRLFEFQYLLNYFFSKLIHILFNTILFRNQYRYFFRYQKFPKPIPILFSKPIFSETDTNTNYNTIFILIIIINF